MDTETLAPRKRMQPRSVHRQGDAFVRRLCGVSALVLVTVSSRREKKLLDYLLALVIIIYMSMRVTGTVMASRVETRRQRFDTLFSPRVLWLPTLVSSEGPGCWCSLVTGPPMRSNRRSNSIFLIIFIEHAQASATTPSPIRIDGTSVAQGHPS